ncbi:hypothetical protein KIL84_009379 [Mauremys mutica]|uniref:Uncharacterized protein n=1 Tax=Mauremys mutica TaxID=74926 RepID=A0A9D3XIJ8_9SAUR|nr:hypothetical protein KIL84_009379 [Mauremys mutica]
MDCREQFSIVNLPNCSYNNANNGGCSAWQSLKAKLLLKLPCNETLVGKARDSPVGIASKVQSTLLTGVSHQDLHLLQFKSHTLITLQTHMKIGKKQPQCSEMS